MPRKVSIVPVILAMMMVMMTTVVPHHHHQAMICLVKEVCSNDGKCDDGHSHHSATGHEEDEDHCVSHEKYFPAENQRVEAAAATFVVESIFPILAEIYCAMFGDMGEKATTALSFTPLLPLVPPLPAAAPNAPPTLA